MTESYAMRLRLLIEEMERGGTGFERSLARDIRATIAERVEDAQGGPASAALWPFLHRPAAPWG